MHSIEIRQSKIQDMLVDTFLKLGRKPVPDPGEGYVRSISRNSSHDKDQENTASQQQEPIRIRIEKNLVEDITDDPCEQRGRPGHQEHEERRHQVAGQEFTPCLAEQPADDRPRTAVLPALFPRPEEPRQERYRRPPDHIAHGVLPFPMRSGIEIPRQFIIHRDRLQARHQPLQRGKIAHLSRHPTDDRLVERDCRHRGGIGKP